MAGWRFSARNRRQLAVPRGAVPVTSAELCCFTATGSPAQSSSWTLAGMCAVIACSSITLFIEEWLREHCWISWLGAIESRFTWPWVGCKRGVRHKGNVSPVL